MRTCLALATCAGAAQPLAQLAKRAALGVCCGGVTRTRCGAPPAGARTFAAHELLRKSVMRTLKLASGHNTLVFGEVTAVWTDLFGYWYVRVDYDNGFTEKMSLRTAWRLVNNRTRATAQTPARVPHAVSASASPQALAPVATADWRESPLLSVLAPVAVNLLCDEASVHKSGSQGSPLAGASSSERASLSDVAAAAEYVVEEARSKSPVRAMQYLSEVAALETTSLQLKTIMQHYTYETQAEHAAIKCCVEVNKIIAGNPHVMAAVVAVLRNSNPHVGEAQLSSMLTWAFGVFSNAAQTAGCK